MSLPTVRPVGARRIDARLWTFSIWAPHADRVVLQLERAGRWDEIETEIDPSGYHEVSIDDLDGDERYRYIIDGQSFADPASRLQPDGVHGPSQLFDPKQFSWSDEGFVTDSFEHWVLYECHLGTFTRRGTFDDALGELERLVELGLNAIELMPVAQFPGSANWGYDGVFPFAVQHSYGGPGAYERFVNRCHELGLAVVQDVVYNHIGPEGNVFGRFGTYFTDRYATPWGDAINFDGPYSDDVRNFFFAQAIYLLEDLHVDGLRLDAIHAIVDQTARPFLRELGELCHGLGERRGRPVVLFAESADNDPAVLARSPAQGLSMDAQWSDDFHHSLHAILTDEHDSFYVDFGQPDQLARAISKGFVYQGDYSAFRKRRHGAPVERPELARYVVYSQNHDQIGNRARGERLLSLVGRRKARLGAGVTLCGSGTPLLFMGEEYGEIAPFAYFVDHEDPALLDAVREGRSREFGEANVFDPGAKSTVAAAVLQRDQLDETDVAGFEALYRDLIALRHERLAVAIGERHELAASFHGPVLEIVHVTRVVSVCLFNFSSHNARIALPAMASSYARLFDSEEPSLGGSGALGTAFASAHDEVVLCPYGFCVYGAERTT